MINTTMYFKLNNETFNTTSNERGYFSFVIIPQQVGSAEIIIYIDDELFNGTNITRTVEIVKNNYEITYTGNPLNHIYLLNRTMQISGKIFNFYNKTFVLKINDKEITRRTNNSGEYSYTYTIDTPGTNTVEIHIPETEFFNEEVVNYSFFVTDKKAVTGFNFITNKTVKYGQNVTFTGSVDPESDLTICFDINGDLVNVTSENFKFNFTYYPSEIGTYNISAYIISDIYYAINRTGSFEVKKLNTTISYRTTIENESLVITYTVKDEFNNTIPYANISINSDDELNVTCDENGEYKYIMENTPETNIITYFGETYCYNPSNNTITFDNLKIKSMITFNPGIISYNNISEEYCKPLSVILTDNNNNSIANSTLELNIDNETYIVKTDENGSVLLNYTGTLGLYNISIVYNGNNIYSPCNYTSTLELRKIKVDLDLMSFIDITDIVDNCELIAPTVFDEYHRQVSTGINEIYLNGEKRTLPPNGPFEYYSQNRTVHLDIYYSGTELYESKELHKYKNLPKVNATMKLMPKSPIQKLGDTININGYLRSIIITNTTPIIEKDHRMRQTNITLNIDGEEINLTTGQSGNFSYFYKPTLGLHNITVSYKGCDLCDASSSNMTFEVIDGGKIDTYIEIDEYQRDQIYTSRNTNLKLHGVLKSENNNTIGNENITLTIDGISTPIQVSEFGEFKIVRDISEFGNYILIFTYEGNEIYNPCNITCKYEVINPNEIIKFTPDEFFDECDINITVNDTIYNNKFNLTGIITFKKPNESNGYFNRFSYCYDYGYIPMNITYIDETNTTATFSVEIDLPSNKTQYLLLYVHSTHDFIYYKDEV